MASLFEVRETLRTTILHIGGTSFTTEKLDRAIRGSFTRFLRETGISRTTATTTLASGSYQDDVIDDAADFFRANVYSAPFINASSASNKWEPIDIVSLDNLRGEYESASGATGKPELLAWVSPSAFWVFPTASAAFDITFPYWQPLTSFTPGTQADVDINIPDQFIDMVLKTGTREWLLGGAPGHPEATKAGRDFEDFIERVKGDAQDDGVWYADENSGRSNNYGPRSY